MNLLNYLKQLPLKVRYFIVAILIIGSMGVWLPLVLPIPLGEEINFNSIPINLTTFYVSIYFAGCIDLILKHVDGEDRAKSKSHILNLIFLILLFFAFIVSTIWLSIKGYFVVPTIIASLGVFIALRLWWDSNIDNPNFSEEIRNEISKKHGKGW